MLDMLSFSPLLDNDCVSLPYGTLPDSQGILVQKFFNTGRSASALLDALVSLSTTARLADSKSSYAFYIRVHANYFNQWSLLIYREQVVRVLRVILTTLQEGDKSIARNASRRSRAFTAYSRCKPPSICMPHIGFRY